MSFGRVEFSITGLRVLSVAALLAEVVSHYARVKPETADFLSGMAIGILLVLVVGLFYAPRATVERMPHEDALPSKQNTPRLR